MLPVPKKRRELLLYHYVRFIHFIGQHGAVVRAVDAPYVVTGMRFAARVLKQQIVHAEHVHPYARVYKSAAQVKAHPPFLKSAAFLILRAPGILDLGNDAVVFVKADAVVFAEADAVIFVEADAVAASGSKAAAFEQSMALDNRRSAFVSSVSA